MKYTIKDPEHAKGGITIDAESPRDALEQYVLNECHDADDGDEVNVEITDETGKEWEGTAEIEEIREVHTTVLPKKKKKTAS